VENEEVGDFQYGKNNHWRRNVVLCCIVLLTEKYMEVIAGLQTLNRKV
jgi:hypothetical protein